MSNEMTPREAMAEAVRLLRDAADELHESHNAPGETTFDGEPEAQAAYEEHERVANALESAIAARLRGEAAPAPVAGDAVAALPRDVQQMVAKDEAAWALAKLAESFGAERDEDDDSTWWVLGIDQFRALATQPPAVGVDVSEEMVWQARAAIVNAGCCYPPAEDAIRAGLTAALRTGGGA